MSTRHFILFVTLSSLAISCSDDDVPIDSGTPDTRRLDATSEHDVSDAEGDPPSVDAEASAELGFDPSNLGPWVHQYVQNDLPDIGRWCSTILFDSSGSVQCMTSFDTYRDLGVESRVFLQDGLPSDLEEVNSRGPHRIVVFFVNSLTLEEGTIVRTIGNSPMAIVATKSIRLERGSLGRDLVGWVGGRSYFSRDEPTGEGLGGGSFGAETGSGGGFCFSGGSGSRASSDSRGAMYGNAELIPFLPGSGGGTTPEHGPEGGNGGGALHLVAGESIYVGPNARIVANGELGVELSQYASGGGSGGAILLEAPNVEVRGLLQARGGRGGDADHGGDGGAPPTDGQNGGSWGEFGGGGGSHGRIRINSDSGASAIAIDAILEPGIDTGCATFGSLHPRTNPDAPETASCGESTATNECENCLFERCCEVLAPCWSDELCEFCIQAEEPGPACDTSIALSDAAACLRNFCTGCDLVTSR